jgi:Tfp pilus assembly protein PilN
MRAVNLIPPDQRQGARTPLRTGGTSYVIVAALAVVLAATTALVLTNNQVADRKSEKATLEAEEQQAQDRASQLAAYTQFADLSTARWQTVASLARSRFDWQRVLHELAIVLPDDVWLVDVTGTVSPGVTVDGAADVSGRDEVAGPALAMVGCGVSQEAVARFAADLKDIDGVTRVGVQESKLPAADSATGSDTSSDTTNCQTRDFIAQFKILAAFDAVPTPTATAPPDSTAPASGASSSSTGTDGGVAEANRQEQAARDSAAQQTDKARSAVGYISGGNG